MSSKLMQYSLERGKNSVNHRWYNTTWIRTLAMAMPSWLTVNEHVTSGKEKWIVRRLKSLSPVLKEINKLNTRCESRRDPPSSITNDLGVASRRILQLKALVFSLNSKNHRRNNWPLVQLYLEGAGVRKHVVICTHSGKNSVNGTDAVSLNILAMDQLTSNSWRILTEQI